MIGSGALVIIRPFSIRRYLEKSMCTIQPITVGDAYNMLSLEGFIQRKLETDTLVKTCLTVHMKDD